MYDAGVTARTVEAANREHEKALRDKGDPVWSLRYHSQSEIETAIGHFHDLWDPDGNRLTRALTRDEQQFITNERRLCALDFRGYWLPNYAWIIDWRKKPVRFEPNVAQNIILDLWADSEVQGHAIWMQQLKARRLGVSTLSELAVQHRFQFHPFTNSVVASADPDKTVEMANIIKFCLEQQPWWLHPKVTKIYKAIPIEFGEQHCTLTIQAGNQFNGVARGSSPNVIHLSELCEWQDAEDLIEAALLPAVLDSPDVFGMLESTAKGPGYWKKKWEESKRDYPRGRSRMRPVFLPWYVGIDIYPTAAALRQRPIPPDWIPTDRTIAHAERARQYVTTDPLLFKYLAKGDLDWKMPLAQMWWREMGYEQAKEAKTLNIFLAEYCADDFEAFQNSNIPVIDPEVLLGYQERTRPPRAVYTIVGPDIPPPLVTPLRYHDQSKPPITIATKELTPRYDVKYQLIPLQFQGYPSLDEGMKLLVWEYPQAGYNYGVGVDCAEGIGQDNTTAQVLREATPTREPGQVAEWASNYVTAFQAWPIMLAMAAMYSTFSPLLNRRGQCRIAIETAANGSSLQNELQKRGWTNFHPWKYNDSKKQRREFEVARVGVITNQWWRSTLMDMLLTCLSEEAIDLPSPYLISELTTLERVPGKRKEEAAEDAFDDRVLAIGHILLSLHMNKPPQLQHARKRVSYVPGLTPEPGEAHPIWTPPGVAIAPPNPFQPSARLVGAAPGIRRAVAGAVHRVESRNGRFVLGQYVNPAMPKGFR